MVETGLLHLNIAIGCTGGRRHVVANFAFEVFIMCFILNSNVLPLYPASCLCLSFVSTLNCLVIERCCTDKLASQDKTCLWLQQSHNNRKMCRTQITADIYPSWPWITTMKLALNTHLMMMYWNQACPITLRPSLCLRGDGGTSACWLVARVRVTSPALCAAY